MNLPSNHKWSFSTIGGVKRVNLENGSDLLALPLLDQKLWTALSCPVQGLEIDANTLQLIDADGDGQIRVPEILQAVNWLLELIKDPNELFQQKEVLSLNSITDGERGKYLLETAKIILSNLGKPDATEISVEDTSDITRIFAGTKFNGDGVITEDVSDDAQVKQLIADIILCVGSTIDRGGKEGINDALIQDFYGKAEAWWAWQERAKTEAASILPFGENTAAAYGTYKAIKAKVEDYFLRCRLASFDPASKEVLNQLNSRIEAITQKDLTSIISEIEAYPIAKVEETPVLNLTGGLNPAWENAVSLFKTQVVDVMFNSKQEINEKEWLTVVAKFEAYEAWRAEEVGTIIASLGEEKIAFALNAETKETLQKLIALDLELADEAEAMAELDRLVRYHRDLLKLLRNFVTFFDFYTSGVKAVFQVGTLYIDQRSCDLCIRVNDMSRHNTMVSLSGMFLLYCKCVSKSTGEEMLIVAALTNGDIDNLIEGRKAIFYDRKGNDYDATIVKIIENPISIRQAFWTPYRRVAKFINTQVNKFASEQDKKVDQLATSKISDAATKADAHAANAVAAAPAAPSPMAAEAPAPAPAFDIGKFVGIFAAIGLAIGAIGTALASIFAGFMALAWWKMPLAIFAIMMLISLPSMIIAWLKLRKRNLAPILDANGWAINAKATVNITFGNNLTHLAALPLGSSINFNDPFKSKGMPIWQRLLIAAFIIGIIVYLLVHFGVIYLKAA
jgi:hypothetical protein